MSEPRFRLRFFFDAGSGICLWSASSAARERFGYAVASGELAISESLRRECDELCAWYDRSLNWDDPSGPSLWTAEEAARFDVAAASLLERLRQELGPDFAIADARSLSGQAGSG